MFNSDKRSQDIQEEDIPQERRKSADRRVSVEETRFPYIDDDCKLVMKNRRSASRRTSDARLMNPLKVVGKLFKK